MTRLPPDDNDPVYQELVIAAHQNAIEGNFDQARSCFLKALQIHSTISLRNDYAIFLRNNGYYENAIDEFKKIHQEAIWKQDLEQLSLVCQNLCSCLLDLGKEQQAENYHQQAISFSNSSDSVNLMQSAEFEISRKNWDKAESILKSASDLCQSFPEEADILGYQGVVNLAKGEPLSSVFYFWKAFRIHREFQAFEEAGIDLMNFAEISKSLDRKQSELRFLKKARSHFIKAGIHSRIEEISNRILLLTHLIHVEQQVPEWN